MKAPLAFISYRRDDEGPSARFVKAELDRYFGPDKIFMDIDDIRTSDEWEKVITKNLRNATILIVAIGKKWLSIKDDHHRRRIDLPGDWVRREIEFAIRHKIKMVPLLLGTELPSVEALPPSLKKLNSSQELRLSPLRWRDDLMALVARMQELGFSGREETIKLPTPVKNMKFPVAYTKEQALKELKGHVGWKVIEYVSLELKPKAGVALEKIFRFKTFEQAIHFITTVSMHVSKVKHHPVWTNTWNTVSVRISTWDTGHVICHLDTDLARYMEQVYAEMVAEKKQTVKRKTAKK